jgi:multisubunit Na+/H+ antiporter MnhB subunit
MDLTNHPLTALIAMLFLTEKLDVYPSWMVISARFSSVFVAFSLLALLVMNFDRYLATYYPIFHRTSVTKGKLLTLLAILITAEITLVLISFNDFVFISHGVPVLIFIIIISPPMLFMNYKMFAIARKSRRNNGISPDMKKTFPLKNISCCLLAVACFLVLSIPVFVFGGLNITSTAKEFTLDNALLAGLWAATITSMNSTCNCLIFYWKNKILRTEGMKVIKSMKICRRVQT